jgi:hypothetical protein
MPDEVAARPDGLIFDNWVRWGKVDHCDLEAVPMPVLAPKFSEFDVSYHAHTTFYLVIAVWTPDSSWEYYRMIAGMG